MSKLNGRILRLAVPNFFASISVPLIGIADTAMVGHLPEVAFLGAVATASVIFDVLFWSTGFLRMGTTSLVAQYHGAGDRRGLHSYPVPFAGPRPCPGRGDAGGAGSDCLDRLSPGCLQSGRTDVGAALLCRADLRNAPGPGRILPSTGSFSGWPMPWRPCTSPWWPTWLT